MPVYGIVGMLQQIRAGLFGQMIGRALLVHGMPRGMGRLSLEIQPRGFSGLGVPSEYGLLCVNAARWYASFN